MNLDQTPKEPTLDELIEQGKDKLFLVANGFGGAEIDSAFKKKSFDETLSESSTGLSSVSSPSDLQSVEPDADLLDWFSGKTLLQKKSVQGVYDEGGEQTGELVSTADPGSAFVKPSVAETKSAIDQASASERAKITATSDEDLEFLKAPKSVLGDRAVAFGRGKDTYEKYRSIAEGPAASFVEYKQNARAAANNALLDGDMTSQERSIFEALRTANEKDPTSGRYLVDAITDRKLNDTVNKNPAYIKMREDTSAELQEIRARLEKDEYYDDPVPIGQPSYMSGSQGTAAELKKQDQEDEATLMAKMIDDHELAIARERRKVLQEAYRMANPKPGTSDKYASAEERFKGVPEWTQKVRAIEADLYASGVPLDIDDDGYVGEPNSYLSDRLADLTLASMTALDLVASGIGSVAELLQVPGAEESLRKHTSSSRELKQQVRNTKSIRSSGLVEDFRFDDVDPNKTLVYIDDMLGSAIESAPFTAIALGVGAVTKSPTASVAAMSYLAGTQAYQESKLDSSFDSFSVNGEPIDTRTEEGSKLSLSIQDYYESGKSLIEDEEGSYLVVDGKRIDVKKGTADRLGYSFALGLAEGAPEAFGAHMLLSLTKAVAKGGSKLMLDNFFMGALKAYGQGTLVEAGQEATTEYLTILADAAIKGEYISAQEAAARVIQASGTGAISGGAVSSTMFSAQRLGAQYKLGDPNSPLWQRMEEGFNVLELTHQMGGISQLGKVSFVGNENVVEKAKKLREINEESKKGEAKPGDLRSAEEALQEAINEMEVSDSDLRSVVRGVANSGRPALAATLVELAQEANRLEGLKGNEEVFSAKYGRVVVSQQAEQVREQLNLAFKVAREHLKSFDAESVGSQAAEKMQQSLLSLEQSMQYEASELADIFGKPVEEVAAYLENVSSTTAYAALIVGDKIETYDSLEKYFEAVPTAERMRTKAQYDPSTKTIHLSPEATSFDIIEEMIHDEVSGQELDFDKMTEELLNSENEQVKAIAEQRQTEYKDSKDLSEEIVAGVLREVRGVEFKNEQLKKLAGDISSKYGTQKILAQTEVSGKSADSQMRDYIDLYGKYVNASLYELDRRVGKETVDRLLSEKGLNRSQASFQDLIDIADKTEGDVSRMKKDARVTFKPEGDMKQVWDAFVSRNLINEDGRLVKDVPVIVMSIDEVGTAEVNGMIFSSGISAEQMSLGTKRSKFVLASSTPSTASRFVNQLKDLMPKGSETAIVLYKFMGEDAARSNVSFFGSVLDQLYNGLNDGSIDYTAARDAILEAHQRSIAIVRAGREYEKVDSPVWVQEFSFVTNGKKRYGVIEAKTKKELETKRKEVRSTRNNDGVNPYVDLNFLEPNKESSTKSLRVPSALSQIWDNLNKKSLSKSEVKELVDEYIDYFREEKIDNKPVYFEMSIRQRELFINTPGIKSLTNQPAITEEIRTPLLEGVDPTAFRGKIGAMAIVDLDLASSERKIPRRGEISQYGYGVQAKNGDITVFKSPINPSSFGFSEAAIERSKNRGKFANEIVDSFTVEEAEKDRLDAKGSRFMGMPDKKFTVTWSEQNTTPSGTFRYNLLRDKEFNDGWHFWNWWVLQTGNGQLTERLGSFSYTDEDGKTVIIKNIPKKKDRQTGKPLELEPIYKFSTQRKMERNQRSVQRSEQKREERESEFTRIEQELKEKTEGSPYNAQTIGHYSGRDEFANPFRGFYKDPVALAAASRLFDVITSANEMASGEVIEWAPGSYKDMSEITSGMPKILLAKMSFNSDSLFLDTMRRFHRKYNFLENEDANIVHSVRKTDTGWEIEVSAAVDPSMQSLVDDYNSKPRPISKQQILDVIQDFQEGREYDDSDVRSARIMPPRFYQLREERGGYQGTIDFLNTWLVNKYADVIGIESEIESKIGKQVPESQRFSEVEQLMYGRARNAMDKLEVVMQDARGLMKKYGISHKDLSNFMYALHAQERNEKILKTRPDLQSGSGMETEVANSIIEQFDSKEFRDLAQMFYDVVEDTRKTMVEEGLETQERIDAWNQLYKNYVPLQGFAEDELDPNSNSYPTGGAGMSVYGSKTKAAIGRESEAANVLANIIMQNAVTHQWAEKNKTLQSLHQLVRKNPDSDVYSVVNQKTPLTKLDENGRQVAMTMAEMEASPNTVAVRIDGKQEFIYFRDPYYAATLNGMTMESTNSLVRMMRAPVGWLRGVFTQWDPNFFVSNFARDMGGALYSAAADLENGSLGSIDTKGFQKEMTRNTFKYLKALLSSNALGRELDDQTQALVAEWKEAGGQTGWNYIEDLKEIEAKLALVSDDLTKAQVLKEALFSTPQKFFTWVEGVNEAFENSIRLSAYVTARNRGASIQKAAVFSKNVTVNFNRSGEAGPVFNSIYLFFNAAIQGNLRVYNSLKGSKPIKKPDGSTRAWYERATNAQKIAAGMAGFSGMLTLLNIALSGRDPEDDELWYNKMSDYDKTRNMIICYGPNRDDFLKVPLPYGYGLFNNLGMALAETSTGNRSVESSMNLLATTAFTSFSPISFGGIDENPGAFVLRSAAPTVIKPFVEMAENKTFFGAPVTGTQLPFGTPAPKSQLSFRAPIAMQEFFEHINESTGGSQFKSGWADFNPDYAWYFFEYMIGGSGDFILDSGEQARNLFEMSRRSANKMKQATTIDEVVKGLGYGFSEEGEVKIRYNDVPIVKKIYGEASPFYDVEKFKENQKVVQQLYREIRERNIVDEPGRYKGIQALYSDLKVRDKLLKKIREDVRSAREIENYIDRQNKIFELYETQRRVMAEWNYKYYQARGED